MIHYSAFNSRVALPPLLLPQDLAFLRVLRVFVVNYSRVALPPLLLPQDLAFLRVLSVFVVNYSRVAFPATRSILHVELLIFRY